MTFLCAKFANFAAVTPKQKIMSTVIYPSPIFGPLLSRRLGISLGVNLMPADGKVCTFNCIYCECGFNENRRPHLHRPTRPEVAKALRAKLEAMKEQNHIPDVITFAGNGEPTAHPDFLGIIRDTIAIRNQLCPSSKISVLSNGTLIDRLNVFEALFLVDNNILKLDTVNEKYIRTVNRPLLSYNTKTQIQNMKRFHGKVIIQTMFMKGMSGGLDVSNLSDYYIIPWLQALQEIKPHEVMIYTIDRDTPEAGLKKATREELDSIVERIEALGIHATASY